MTVADSPPFDTYVPLLEMLAKFDDAVHKLTGTRTEIRIDDRGNRMICTAESLYAEMETNLAGQQGTAFGGVARSLPPLWIDGVDWKMAVDDTIRAWTPSLRGTTPERLTALLVWGWTPEDVVWLATSTRELEGWAHEADELITGRNRFSVTAQCPACSAHEIERVDFEGEHSRVPVLQITGAGASCLACSHAWGLDDLMWLAASLGCTPLAGVDPGVYAQLR